MSTPDTMGDRDTAERQTLSREVVVSNSQGLHARPADLLAREARKWRSRIELVVDAHRVDGKSILDVLTLAAEAGTRVVIEATGPDARDALDAIGTLFAKRFNELEEPSNHDGSTGHRHVSRGGTPGH
jgi:phosphotransferase system HPr (HPr) family protein